MIRNLFGHLEVLWRDGAYGARLLFRRPAFTLVVVAVLAIGTGANAVVFTWIRATLLNPVPGSSSTRGLVAFARPDGLAAASYPDFLDLRSRLRSFRDLVAYQDNWTALTGTGSPERVYAAIATANYFEVLGARPVLGRGFLSEEERAIDGAPVVVISHRMWQQRFRASPAVIGRTLEVNRRAFTIIGVAPPDFAGCKTALLVDLWMPVSMAKAVTGEDQLASRSNTWFNLVGRLDEGVGRRQAQAELDDAMRRLVAEDPAAHDAGSPVTLHPLWSSPIGANGIFVLLLPLLLAAAAAVLVLTCANVTNLVLVRWFGRSRELAIRSSIGATRGRLRHQLLIESIVLALAGGLGGLLLASWTVGSFTAFMPRVNIPLSLSVDVGPAVLVATLLLSLVAGVAVGLLPAMRAAEVTPFALLRQEAANLQGGVARSRLVSAFVVAQVTVSVVLLCAAGLLVRSARNASQLSPGFEPAGVLLATFDLLPADFTREEGEAFHRELLGRVGALPGVESVTLTDWVPLSYNRHTSRVQPEGYEPRPEESLEIGRANVGPDYFRTMRIPLVAGRDLSIRDDRAAPPAAVVNETFAARYWPGQSALGRRVFAHGRWWTVVGVARDAKYQTMQEAPEPFIYLALLQHYYHEATLHVRVTGAPLRYAAAVVGAVHAQDPHLPVYHVTTLAEQARASSTFGRMAALFIGVCGGIALLLAMLGVYGVLTNVTRQRTREVGIRLALGAAPSGVLRLVITHGLRLTGIGLLIGLPLALALTRVLRGVLVGVSASDPLTFAGATVLLAAVSFIVCYVPARRAAKLDPLRALHAD